MKPLAVLMGSKGRPTQLAAAVWSLWSLAHDRSAIQFYVTMDADDCETRKVCEQLEEQIPLAFLSGSSSPVNLHNDILSVLDSDVNVTWWNDRNVCMTQGWDRILREYLSTYTHRICWWSDRSEAQTLIGAMPHAYLNATGRKWAPGIFPFWFNDLWHMEIDMLMSRQKGIVMPAAFGGLHKTTIRGREFRFWTELFIQTRNRRIDIAQQAAYKLKMAWTDPLPFIHQHWAKSDQWALDNADELEAQYGDKREPDQVYLDAKRNALEFLPVTA